MTRSLRSHVLVALAALPAFVPIASANARAEEPPFASVRKLEALQDQVANGSAIAQSAYAKAIGCIARSFQRADPTTWRDPRNARALVSYLFSGGHAATIAQAIPADALVAEQRALYEGALAYGMGDDEKARALLMPIDAKTLPSGLGAHLALVQATLLAETDRTRAIALLDLARLLAPGTLIEEAALRKEMSLVGAARDIDKFSVLARRYLGVFSKSVYADNFRQLVGAAAVEIGRSDSADATERLLRVATHLDKEDRRRLYLAIAREAVIAGRIRMAVRAAEEASKLAPHASAEEARANVYRGAAMIVGDRYDIGTQSLREASAERLDVSDRALRASAMAVAELIRKPSPVGGDPASGTAPTLIGQGERQIETADRALKDARR